MIEELEDKKKFRYNFFVDNFFKIANLLCTLKANGYGDTGTLRENRLPQNFPLPSKKDFEKKARGYCCSALDKERGIIYVRWMDNRAVTVASTCFGVAPIRPVDIVHKDFSQKRRQATSHSRLLARRNHH